ncbi:hypothetical protein HDV04_005779 [Boothiomyces sp. JEL0838]|nr:hypothetical protein HDV04_005779 [Boothiomyces sp. JEL0838]
MITIVLLALSALAAPVTNPLNKFKNYFVIVFENQNYDTVLNNAYMGKVLPSKGRLLTNYHGVTHPSQPNYIAMTSGSPKGVFLDFHANVDKRNLADNLEAIGKTWKTYQQDYPQDQGCFLSDQGNYYRKHNPFVSYVNVHNNPNRCANIVNAKFLDQDIANKKLPNYMFYTPNIKNDGHDTDIDYASNWLQGFLEPLLENPVFDDTLFVITFDESDAALGVIDFKGNHIYTLLLGKSVTPGSQDSTYYTHYSQIATLNEQWGVSMFNLNDYGAAGFDLQ